MKGYYKFSIFCWIHILLVSCGGTNQESLEYINTFPKYEEVLNTFFDNGKSPRYPEKAGYYLSFAKKPQGWYVLDTKLGTGKQSNFRLFWSAKTQKFLPEAKEGTKLEKEENIVQRYLNTDANQAYDANLFYGYDTWTNDVIEVLEGKSNVTDELLFALANAYSYQAKKSLGFYTLNFEEKREVKPKVKEAIKYFRKAIAYFEKLKKQNPQFKTFIGNISLKTANEYMNAFYLLKIAGFEKEAKSMLKSLIYEDFYLSFAKNLLNSCRKNAILFTNGDVDTYTLLYVQNHLNYRKDVKIVNLAMLYANWYLSYQIKNLGKLNITEKTYHHKLLDLVLLKQEEEEADFTTIATAFNQKNARFVVELNNNQRFFQIKSSKIKISDKILLNYTQPYLYKPKIVLLDIVASFINQKPLCFSSTVSTDFKGVFMYHNQMEGLVSNITENIKKDTENQVNLELTQKFIDEFEVEGVHQKIVEEDKLSIISNYRHLFSSLANAYLEKGKKEKALQIAEKILKIFPKKYVKYDYYTLPLIRTFYENNKLEKANQIITNYLVQANQALKNPKDKEKEIALFQYGTYYLLNILNKEKNGMTK